MDHRNVVWGFLKFFAIYAGRLVMCYWTPFFKHWCLHFLKEKIFFRNLKWNLLYVSVQLFLVCIQLYSVSIQLSSVSVQLSSVSIQLSSVSVRLYTESDHFIRYIAQKAGRNSPISLWNRNQTKQDFMWCTYRAVTKNRVKKSHITVPLRGTWTLLREIGSVGCICNNFMSSFPLSLVYFLCGNCDARNDAEF